MNQAAFIRPEARSENVGELLARATLTGNERRLCGKLVLHFGAWVPVARLVSAIDAPIGGIAKPEQLLAELARSARIKLADHGLTVDTRTGAGHRLSWLTETVPVTPVRIVASGQASAPGAPPGKAPLLREGDILLGQTDRFEPVGLDLGKLLEGRLLIQGNSGAGKSMLLRRLFEQTFGRVQQILVDPDGEFSTLAEHFDVAVLNAAEILRVGGRALALHLREHRYSAVLDLSDAATEDRLAVTADLASGLIEAPEHHWQPVLVLVDEAQTFAPHYDTGEVTAETRKRSTAALADLMGRGRKRGIAGVIATQRLAETAKAVAAKATNVIVGRTFLDRDLERAGGLLGFTAGHSKALRTLEDGEFICLGPAMAGPRRVRFKAGPAQSRHKGRAPSMEVPPSISAAGAAELLRAVPDATGPAAAPATKARGVRGRGWDPEEDRIVAAGYRENLAVREIAGRLAAAGFRHRSVSGISTRARDLGFVSNKAAAAWSPKEDEIVVAAYAKEVRIIDIVGLLSDAGYERGRVSVQMRAIALGITRDRVNYWTEPEKAIATAGLESGKPYREIVAELREAGYERGLTSILKFAQKNNFDRSPDPWTHEQIDLLRQRYEAKVPVKDIARELGKTEAGIRTKASLLGLKQRIAWTDQERHILREACERGDLLIDAAARIGRPYPNVSQEAVRLRLSFRKTGRGGVAA